MTIDFMVHEFCIFAVIFFVCINSKYAHSRDWRNGSSVKSMTTPPEEPGSFLNIHMEAHHHL